MPHTYRLLFARRWWLTLSLVVAALALTGCNGTPQQQADKAHAVYVQTLRTTDQLVLEHKIPKPTERVIRDELIPAARGALTVVDESVPAGGVTFKAALDGFYAALQRWADAQAKATTRPSR